MPIGDSKAGAADPQFLNFLFNRMDQRAKNERQAKLDQLAAMTAFEEERRKNEDHRVKMLKSQFDLEASRSEENARLAQLAETAEGNTQTAFKSRASENRAQERQGAFELPPGIEGPVPSADILTDADISGEFGQGVLQQNFGPIESRIRRQSELESRVTEEDPQAIAERRGEMIGLRGQTDERLRQQELSDDAGKGVRKIMSFRRSIDKVEDRISTLTPGTKAFDRAGADMNALAAGLVRLVNEGVAGAVLEARRRQIDDVALLQQAGDQVATLDQFIAAAEVSRDFLGWEGQAAGLEQFFVDANLDLRAIFDNQVRGFFDDEYIDEDVKNQMREQLSGLLGPGDEVLAQRSTDLRMLSKMIAFTLVRLSNPTRFAEAQVRRFEEFTDFEKGTSSQALRDMRTVRGAMSGMVRRTRERVLGYNRVLGLGNQGDIVTRDRQGRERTVFDRPTSSPFQSTRQLSGEEFLQLTPTQQAQYAAQQEANQ